MVYVIFAAVMCSIQAAKQGGAAYRVMLFSIIVTYGSALPFFAMMDQCGKTDATICAIQCTPFRVCWRSIPGTCSQASFPTCSYLPPMSTFSKCEWHDHGILLYLTKIFACSYAFSNLDDVSL